MHLSWIHALYLVQTATSQSKPFKISSPFHGILHNTLSLDTILLFLPIYSRLARTLPAMMYPMLNKRASVCAKASLLLYTVCRSWILLKRSKLLLPWWRYAGMKKVEKRTAFSLGIVGVKAQRNYLKEKKLSAMFANIQKVGLNLVGCTKNDILPSQTLPLCCTFSGSLFEFSVWRIWTMLSWQQALSCPLLFEQAGKDWADVWGSGSRSIHTDFLEVSKKSFFFFFFFFFFFVNAWWHEYWTVWTWELIFQ